MDVSIICPIHGDGRHLHQTLESIKAQNFTGTMELIIILDRCSENVPAKIREFSRLLDIKVVHSKNPGLVAALNLGLQNATGKYVARIDADDMMMPTRIEKQFNFMESNYDVDVLGSSVIEINEYGVQIGLRCYPEKPLVMHASLAKQCTIAHPSVMFRLNSILAIGSYRPFFEHAEDYDLWLRARECGLILSNNEPLTYYRIHPGQISTIQHRQRVFGSYSVRINSLLERRKLRNLIDRYETFDRWAKSIIGRVLYKYVALRIYLAEKMKNQEENEFRNNRFDRFLFGMIFARIKKFKEGRKR